ncbi:MAG: hypothetical protein WC560_09525 [Syntrophales bacterium]
MNGFVHLFTDNGAVSTNDPTLPRAQGSKELREMIVDVPDTMKSKPFIQPGVGSIPATRC